MTTNGCTHPRTQQVREGDDSVVYCLNPNCGAEVSRVKDYYKDNDDD